MIKNSVYIIISMFFVVVLIVFLTFNPDSYNIDSSSESDIILTKKAENAENPFASDLPETVVFTGGSAEPGGSNSSVNNILTALSLMKCRFAVADSMANIGEFETIIIASPDIGSDDISALKDFLSQGGVVVFAVLPEIMTEELLNLLEIYEYDPDYQIKGFDVYGELLLGDMMRLYETEFSCAKVTLSGRCKVFANGHDPDRDTTAAVIDEKDNNPIIWRTYYENGTIFAVNAPFMEDAVGMGILSGILSLTGKDFIYPVIGTKTVVLENFQYTAEDSLRIYERSAYVFMRDIVWPALVAAGKEAEIVYTCCPNGNFALSANSYASIKFLTNELYKTKGEMGYTVYGGTGSDTLETDMLFMETRFPNHRFRSYFAQADTDISALISSKDTTAVITDSWEGAFTWLNDSAVRLPVTSCMYDDNIEYRNLEFISVLSALGIVIHKVDMETAFSRELEWTVFSKDLGDDFAYLFNKCGFLTSATAKKTAEAVKNYLNLDMSVQHTDEGISVSLANFTGEASFFLRTAKTVDTSRNVNCTAEKIDDGIYLIKSSESSFSVSFENHT